MKGVNVAGVYLLLSTVGTFLLLAIPGAPFTFALFPISLSTVGFVVFLPQSLEFIALGAALQASTLPAWASAAALIFDFLVALGLMAS
ncbi:MAG: hypothetical protein KGI38_12135 [Thaumarchaeota archaeon]|nr:hypothetical protein [Nitrososphaerota archaeon]